MDTVRSGLMGDNRSEHYSTRRRVIQGNRGSAVASVWGFASGDEHTVWNLRVFGVVGACGVE